MKKECPKCGYSWRKTSSERSDAIKKALKNTIEKVGRPRKANYQEIYKLRDSGFSLQAIASKIKKSRGSVQHALRIRL